MKHTGRNDETQLIRTIAMEIHTIARHLLHQPDLQEEGDNLRQGTKRLLPGEIAQWEQHVQDEEQEAEEMAMSLAETGEEPPQSSERKSLASSADPHRRRRELAAHHKEFIGEDPHHTDDENCLMAMGRDFPSSPSDQDEAPRENAAPEPEETTGRMEVVQWGEQQT